MKNEVIVRIVATFVHLVAPIIANVAGSSQNRFWCKIFTVNSKESQSLKAIR